MKVAETNPCDTCKKFSVCMFSQEYLQIKDAIKNLPFDGIFLKSIDPVCKFFEGCTNKLR